MPEKKTTLYKSVEELKTKTPTQLAELLEKAKEQYDTFAQAIIDIRSEAKAIRDEIESRSAPDAHSWIDESSGRKSKGGRRTRSSPEEVEALGLKILSALKGSTKKDGKRWEEVEKSVGNDSLGNVRNKLVKEKKIAREGPPKNATWYILSKS